MYPFFYLPSFTADPSFSFVDPEDLFGAIFGGAAFVPIIGHISLAKDMKEALQEADDELGECRACGVCGAVGLKRPYPTLRRWRTTQTGRTRTTRTGSGRQATPAT